MRSPVHRDGAVRRAARVPTRPVSGRW
jgi:hypothetical protein